MVIVRGYECAECASNINALNEKCVQNPAHKGHRPRADRHNFSGFVCAECGARINKWRWVCTVDDGHKGEMTTKQFEDKDKPPPSVEEMRATREANSKMIYGDGVFLF